MPGILPGASPSMHRSEWPSRPIPAGQKKIADAGIEGMKAARAIALISYRHYDTYDSAPTEDEHDKPDQVV